MIYIIYPEERYISDAQVTSWFTDAVANGDVSKVDRPGELTTNEMAAALEDAGLITRGRKK